MAIAADEFGESLRLPIANELSRLGLAVADYSQQPGADYPDLAKSVALAIASGHHQRGILICGTGLGMAVVANKIPGIRAVTAHDLYSAERARKSLNAQILAMGAQILDEATALQILTKWLESEYEGGRSVRKYARMIEIDAQFRAHLDG